VKMADKSKNTGTGGIEIDGKAYSMDVGVSDSNGGPQGAWSPGDIAVDNTQKDITKPTRETFAKYLSRATLAKIGSATHPNAYPVGQGDSTENRLISNTDKLGNPVPPGQSLNEARFDPLLNSAMSPPPPLAMKRGQAAGNAPDGNRLLPNAATPGSAGGDYIKPSKGLNEPIKGYTQAHLTPNLYSPLDESSTPAVVVSGGDLNESPQNVRDVRYVDGTSGIDGGTSRNILGPDATGAYTLTLAEQRALAAAETTGNRYPVDKPGLLPPTKLTDPQGDPLPVTAAQNSIDNTRFFSKEIIKVNNQNFVTSRIQSSYTTALDESKPDFTIRRGKESGGAGPDGNDLLPNATTTDPVTGEVKLRPSLVTYTGKVLDPNLHSPLGSSPVTEANKVVIGDGGDVLPENTRNPQVVLIGDPKGDSSVVMAPDANRTLTLRERVEYAAAQTTDPAGPSGANAYPVDGPSPVFNPVRLVDTNGNPVAPSPSPENSSYFTKDIGVVPSLQTYSPSLAAASQVNDDAFVLKRGKTSRDDGIDGNKLLAEIASTENGVTTLTPEATTYLGSVLDPNPRSPLKDPPNFVEDFAGENDVPTWPLHIAGTTGRKGTSEDVFNATPINSITLFEAQSVPRAQQVSVQQAYFVDDPAPPGGDAKLPLFSLSDGPYATPSVTDQQNNPNNSDYYTKGKNLSTSYSDNVGSLDIKRGRAAADPGTQDGNELLPSATDPGSAGGPHVKPAGKLNDPIKKYVKNVFGKNLRVPGSNLDDASTTDPGDFFGPKSLFTTAEITGDAIRRGPQDEGTFDNIINDPRKRKLSKGVLIQHAASQVAGKVNVPGEIANRYSPGQLTAGSSQNDAPGNILVTDYTLVDADGYPRSPSEAIAAATGDGDDPVGFTQVHGVEFEVLNTYTETAQQVKLNDSIKRGKSKKDAPDGNELLIDVSVKSQVVPLFETETVTYIADPESIVSKYTEELLKNNRFKSGSRFAPAQMLTPHSSLEAPRTFRDVENEDSPREVFERNSAMPASFEKGTSKGKEKFTGFRRLSRIGTILQLRASGEIGSNDPSIDPRDGEIPIAALAPGVGQVAPGIPLSSELLNVDDIIKNLAVDSDFDKSIYNGELKDFGRQFEGTINNVFDKFSGFTALGMLLTSIALVTAITVAFNVLGELFSDPISANNLGERKQFNVKLSQSTGRPGVGSYRGPTAATTPDDIISMFIPIPGINKADPLYIFGIQPTKIPFSIATELGIKNFFGIDSTNPFRSKALQSPGYYVIIARSIIRSAIALVAAFVDLIEKFFTGAIFAGIEAICELFYSIKKSRFIATLNIFAQLGDKSSMGQSALDQLFGAAGLDPADQTEKGLDAGQKTSYLDALPNSAAMKNRLIGTTKLAWASNRTRDLLSISAMSHALSFIPELGSGRLLTNDPYQLTRFATPINSNRLSQDLVNVIEGEYDSTYVPFYFQDLRTNEILGFHAFLSTLTDDYTASYESSDGFGRMDPVKTYKNTTRKISLSFLIAATDEDDFDSMWLKINKLTTLLYPQYTAGKSIDTKVNGKNYSFIRPFTQQISAAPMVRMRIGDFINSNYSKFNLAGIFGLTQSAEKTILNDESLSKSNADRNTETYMKNIQKLAELRYVYDNANADLTTVKYWSVGHKFIPKTGKVDEWHNEISPITSPTIPGLPPIDYSVIRDQLKFLLMTNLIEYFEIVEAPDPSAAAYQSLKIKVIFKKINEAERGSMVSNAAVPLIAKLEKYTFQTNISFLYNISTLSPESYTRFLEKSGVAPVEYLTASDVNQDIKQFLQDDPKVGSTNSIAKSFRSTSGRGLAGFIDNINFDWLSQTTWEISSGKVAPKMCKVTMGFSPVHDIQPGLDSNGYNRAPIYPVGPYAPKQRPATVVEE
jgi:hypothetical protein